MKRILNQILNTETGKKLFLNFSSLSILQFLQYLFPLITVPYIVRVIGPHNYGVTALAFALVNWFILFVDYGFNLSATRRIAQNAGDKRKVSEIFHSVLIIKSAFLVIGSVAFTTIVITVPKFAVYKYIYLTSFTYVVSSFLFPLFFFQGIEKMKLITLFSVLSKLLYIPAIFLLINKADDYIHLPLIGGISAGIGGVLSILYIYTKLKLSFLIPSMATIKEELISGKETFASTMLISLYTTSNTFILGLFAPELYVGYYSAAEKLLSAVRGGYTALTQTLYPHAGALSDKSENELLQFLAKTIKLVALTSFVGAVLTYLFASNLVILLFGVKFGSAIIAVKIMSCLIFVVSLSNILGIVGMLNLKYEKAFLTIIFFAVLFHLPLAFYIVPAFNYIGTSINVVITELFVTVSMLIYLMIKKPVFKEKLVGGVL